jgi:hypothetical protein
MNRNFSCNGSFFKKFYFKKKECVVIRKQSTTTQSFDGTGRRWFPPSLGNIFTASRKILEKHAYDGKHPPVFIGRKPENTQPYKKS